MLLERLGLALTLPVLLYACASGVPPAPVIPPGPAVPPALNPVGVYDIVAALEGLTLYVELTIEGSSEAGYSGQVADPRGATAVTGIEVTGQTLAFAVPELGSASGSSSREMTSLAK